MTAPHTRVPVGSADVLPRLAAARWPHRTALRAGTRSTTFAELDDAVSRLAFGLRQLIGGDGLPVVVSAALGTAFPAAFHAVLRSGNVAVPVNPRMPAEPFAGVLAESGARAALLGRVTYERVRRVLAGARLEQVVLYDAPAEAGQPTCADLAGRGSLLVEPRDRDEHAAATVEGRRVRTHHELKTAALATADGLDPDSVVLNATSAYHPADLGAGLAAGATQVLLGNPDPAAAVREAARAGATHVRRDGGTTAVAA
ncbi:AMP-binding protein [Actinophytocola gossypii]|uniref:AMP-binding protein n=1 Tax=Actinophytocola gossypii TaxID=2812003 RepID=A0ABT2JKR0_9PSEU|nr:AMP-binding protein [Actinophytocola gossypii]MCT2587980.1 AMP-binding protein [Actinophytocola gossypii]